MTDDKILQVAPGLQWIGVLDRELVTFDVVMHTPYGTTYNSYFIEAEKKAIVETVKNKYFPVFLSKLSKLTDPSEIQYIIVNHTEPDHSGSLIELLKVAPHATVVGSGVAIRYLRDLLGIEFPYLQVKDGDILDLGNKKLRFIGAANLHWPDSMYTYVEDDKVLFTCDSFGAHFCDPLMFDDLVANWDDAFKYYFDVILKPFSKFMLKAIEKIRLLEINAVCPGHGPILRSNWKKYVGLSETYAREALREGEKPMVFIPYVSAYQNTRKMAEKIGEGISKAGDINVEVHDIEEMPFDRLEHYVADCKGMVVGSPTINQNILLQIYQLFAAVNPIRDRGKLAGVFGSFGWSGEAEKMIESNLVNLKLKYSGESLFVKFTPHSAHLEQCVEYGKAFGEKLLANAAEE